ncbi:PcfJ domain-containing protein [Thomasclavelia sp.]|uniref:PcfJ domain-containing protein n=1 Tax=Thomasclavelia sp. TaxID=3025757 RepID=UPI0025FC46E2|nr:PcfJ domain-containing protein [Thomasclavelia sp.]
MKNSLENKLLEELKTHEFRKYSENYFKKYFATSKEIGNSKRKRVITSKVINIYSSYKKRLLCRSFYIAEGFENKKFYRHIYEIKRQLAGMEYILTNRIYAGMGGIRILTGDWCRYYFFYSAVVTDDEILWEERNVDTYVLYTGSRYKVIEHNDYRPFLNNSIHRYCAYEYTDYLVEEIFIYLKKYDKYPRQIEMLAKAGLNHLIRNTSGIRFSKSFPDFLGVEKRDIKYLKYLELPLIEFRKNLDWIRKYSITDKYEYMMYKLLFENNIKTSEKLISYLKNQLLKIKEDLYSQIGCHNNYSILDVTNLYLDYIGMCKKMAVICNSSNKYPAYLKKAHDELAKKIKIADIEIKNRQILVNSKKYDKYIYFFNDYLIVPCRSVDELNEESRILNHCVKTYADRVAQNKTEIFFIRKKIEPNTPYTTLELKNREIIQCYCKNNNIPDDDIKTFVKSWANKNKFKLNCWGG